MTIDQMSLLKRWHVAHREEAPLEYHAWDAVLTLWVIGWVGLLPAVVLAWGWLLPVLMAFFVAPVFYVRLRRRLHASGRLRCDWLPALG